MKKFNLIRTEIVPMSVTEVVEVEAENLKEAIELVVDGYGEIKSSDEMEVSEVYQIAKYRDNSTLRVTDINNKLLYNDNNTFAYGYNPYKCFE